MYSCSKCDAQSPKWSGRCTECGGWGTLVEGAVAPRPAHVASAHAAAQKPKKLSDVASAASAARFGSGDPEIDRVLGNGFVHGSLVLISGEPGIGKSTLVAQIAARLAMPNVLYISGEESGPQLAGRFARLGGKTDHITLLEPFPIESLVATIEKEKPDVAIVDSVQTLTSSIQDGGPGTTSMVRYATSLLLDLAKRSNTAILLIGQVTKDGAIAGPKTLEHLVDVVLTLEGDPVHAYRILRATKNRFGATDEVGVFEMAQNGLVAVQNPSARFLKERTSVPGSVVTAVMEGSRSFLVEIQALVDKSFFGMPVRRASGFDQNRLQLLCAILSKRAGVRLGEKDVYLNVIGGLTLTEPAVDLAVCAAILQADRGTTDPEPVLYVGEVGLGGELRSVPLLEKRLHEAERLGIHSAVVPANSPLKSDTLSLRRIKLVSELAPKSDS